VSPVGLFRTLRGNGSKMAALLRSALKFSSNLSRAQLLHRVPIKTRIVQPACAIFTSNKKKDAVSIPAAEKEVNEPEKLDNLLEKDEVPYIVYCDFSSFETVFANACEIENVS